MNDNPKPGQDKFLSTPSGWRATLDFKFFPCFVAFLSTPSGWRATHAFLAWRRFRSDFYPRPPGGGRRSLPCTHTIHSDYFYPRPPGGGRQDFLFCYFWVILISIHALRVEGDVHRKRLFVRCFQFLSTPSGWRATCRSTICCTSKRFLSTPSGWRATIDYGVREYPELDFYPRPPGGGRLVSANSM